MHMSRKIGVGVGYWLALVAALCGLFGVFFGFIEHGWVTYSWVVLLALSAVQIYRFRNSSHYRDDDAN